MAGDAPDIGRVGRMPVSGVSKGIRRRRRRGESGRGDRLRNNRKRVMISWSILLMVVVMGLVGTAVWLQVRPSGGGGDGTDPQRAVQERISSRFPSPTEDEALYLVKRALSIRLPKQLEDCFILGSTRPEDALRFLRDAEKADGGVSGYTWLSSMDANGLLIDGVLVNYAGGGVPKNRLALLTPDAKGKWKIDFDAFARMVRPSWKDLMENGAPQGVVRVVVARDVYFNGPFKDDSQWMCYGMASPDIPDVLLGYCRKRSPQAAALERILADEGATSAGATLNRATLEIRRVEGSEARQFEITRVLAEDWVMGAKPFDENFK